MLLPFCIPIQTSESRTTPATPTQSVPDCKGEQEGSCHTKSLKKKYTFYNLEVFLLAYNWPERMASVAATLVSEGSKLRQK